VGNSARGKKILATNNVVMAATAGDLYSTRAGSLQKKIQQLKEFFKK